MARRAATRASSPAPIGPAAARPPRPARRAVSRSPSRGQHVQAHHVVGRAAVPQRPRAAGVVADRAADAGPRVGGRIGAEPQPVPGRGGGDVVQDRARLDDRGARLGSTDSTRFRCREKSSTMPGADRVARDGGAAAPAGDRHAELPSRPPARRPPPRRAGGRRPRSGTHAVVGRVGGVLRPPPGRVIHLGQARGRAARRPAHAGAAVLALRAVMVTVTDAISPRRGARGPRSGPAGRSGPGRPSVLVVEVRPLGQQIRRSASKGALGGD